MVIILDEKQQLPAPPPYAFNENNDERDPAPPFPGSQLSPSQRPPATFDALPPHLVLHIVNLALTPRTGRTEVEYTRKVLYWMTVCLRLVNRSLCIACMHVLRSTYLPAYLSMIKPPYTSDPFPLLTPGPSGSSAGVLTSSSTLVSPVNSVQRETQVLDLFMAAKVREDVWADASELHLEREEAFQDLFSVIQPRARLEDLVRTYGVAAGIISISTSTGNTVIASAPCASSSSPSPSSSSFPQNPTIYSPATPSSPSSTTTTPTSPSFPHPFPRAHGHGHGRVTRRIPFGALSCSFGPRSAGLVLTSKGGRRTIVEVPRAREEKLEVAAKRLVRGLEGWVLENNTG